ncbi:protein LATERAL ROOT PRIMORDIUM 1 [Pistacia vera]|uniref:protein LATERAL ROOT PRIMORDIUM 1 n=1 Tax=Pistacia vera TaxID=55513 RepID=UPI001262B6CA|nr:protein LATERAL ROOT PRIMORDIUM 1 [Pistacia vera]
MGMVGLRDVFVVAPASSFNHHHHHHHHDSLNIASDPINSANATALGVGVGVGVIPLLTAGPCLASPQSMEDQDLLNNGRNKVSQIQFWQNQNSHPYLKKGSSTILDHNTTSSMNLLQGSESPAGGTGAGGNSNMGSGAGSASSSGTTCQDCGNQAKKDCTHRRCRTCCKSRGYDCATHVKSTWVPAARRRERQLMVTAGTMGGAGSSGSTSGIKKPRLINSQTTTNSHTSTSTATPPRSFDTSSSHQDASFKETLPGQVRAPAVFKCVRVTAVEDGEDEYAYQAVVKIGGHVFKGFLYDQGVDNTREGFPNISELHLGGAGSSGGVGGGGGGGGGRNGGCSSPPILDPSEVYAGGGGLLGGSGYGNPMN